MYTKLKYIILSLLFIGFGLSLFNNVLLSDFDSFYIFQFPAILSALLVIFFFLPRKLKIQSIILTISALLAASTLTLAGLFTMLDYYEQKRTQQVILEYNRLSCEQMREKFRQDLDNNRLKFFYNSMGADEKFEKALEKLNIEVYHEGCSSMMNYDCYKVQLKEHLKKEKNINLDEL